MKLGSYIKGERSGREAYDLERRAMGDPLLADALDGFDAVAGDHADAIARLRERIAADVRRRRSARRSRSMLYMRTVAASLLLCLCLGGYLAWMLRAPQPTYGTLPAYPDLEPWEGSRELIAENRSCHGTSCPETRLPVGFAPDLLQDDAIPASPAVPDDRRQALMAMAESLDRAAASETLEPMAVADASQESEQAVASLPAVAQPASVQKTIPVQKSAARGSVRGIVTDDASNPLAGVIVVVEGTERGAVTDAAGAYSIDAAAGDKLLYSYIGYGQQSKAVDGPSLDVALKPGRTSLDEVVVVGYGTRRRADKPGKDRAAGEVSAAPLEEPLITAEQMPVFRRGGVDKFHEWILPRLVYAGTAEDLAQPGGSTVAVSFIVEKDGSVGKVTMLSGSNELLADEVIRVVGSSPRWKPGKQGGEPVRVKLTLQVRVDPNK